MKPCIDEGWYMVDVSTATLVLAVDTLSPACNPGAYM